MIRFDVVDDRPHHLDEGLERNDQVLVVPPEEHPVSVLLGTASDLGGQAGLADSRFADQPDPTVRFVSRGTTDHLPCLVELGTPTDEQLSRVGLELAWKRSRVGRCGRRANCLVHPGGPSFGDETVPAAVHGLHRPLGPAVIAKGPSNLLDPGGQGRLGNEAIAPDVVEQFFLRDEPARLFDQVLENCEHLGLDVDLPLWPRDLNRVGIDRDVTESIARHESAGELVHLGDHIGRKAEVGRVAS